MARRLSARALMAVSLFVFTIGVVAQTVPLTIRNADAARHGVAGNYIGVGI